ncbi:MAG TPA: hypothetical protein DDZ76_15530 [Xanthomonadales bacterium]|nr:hypothetical protein [Xanthomonadales bacterium]
MSGDPDTAADGVAWSRLEALFHGALAIPEAQRAAWLTAATEDPELRAEVMRLLAVDAGADGVLESAIAHALVETVEASAGSGRTIGAYRTIRELGRGGSGTVYLARRVDGAFEQDVAIKLVRQSLIGADLDARLLSERRILARLDHPCIARLLDGGSTDDGQPYFVMEVIDGLPIDVHCDRHRLTVDQRLRLLGQVCEAVDYAHRNLVVHRDLKPSNVLVRPDGTPKLLDFGIAKLLDPVSEEPVTVTLLRMGTPGYASPEQILGEPITTASDVFSLGVLLYQLLTGVMPFPIDARGALHAVERAIVDGEPVPASAAALRAGNASAALRRERPESLARRLRGDLDTILATALRKEPLRRYGSALQLAEDIQRHLAGHPVSARPDTLAYRAGKFMHRHRFGVATAVLATVALLAFGVALFVQEARTARQRDRAEQVSAMLIRMFEVAGPTAERGSAFTARELLDRGRAELGALDRQPETQAELLETLGGLYERLGLFDDARAVFEQALDRQRELRGDRHPAVAEALHRLGRAAARSGDYPTAERLFRQALDLHRELLGDQRPEVAIGLNSLALVLHETGEYQAADPLYRRALEKSRRLFGEDHPQTVKTQANLALLLHDSGDHAAAVEMFRLALGGWQNLPGQEEMVAEVLAGLALSLHAVGDPEAEPVARRALELRQRLFEPDHPFLARSLGHLGRILRDRDPVMAERLLEDALERRLRLLGEPNAETAESLADLAALRVIQGRADEAEALYVRAIEGYRRSLTRQHPMLAAPMRALARLLAARGECAAADALLVESARLWPSRGKQAAPAGDDPVCRPGD